MTLITIILCPELTVDYTLIHIPPQKQTRVIYLNVWTTLYSSPPQFVVRGEQITIISLLNNQYN